MARNDALELQIQGVDNLLIKFNTIKYETKYKTGRFALRKAAQLVRDAARANAQNNIDDPSTSQNIALNIVERWGGKGMLQNADLAFRVGVLGGARRPLTKEGLRSQKRRRRQGVKSLAELGEIAGKGKNNPGGDTWYWRFHEFGTEKMRATPFLQPAMTQNIDAAIDEFVKQYTVAIDRAIKRAAKKGQIA